MIICSLYSLQYFYDLRSHPFRSLGGGVGRFVPSHAHARGRLVQIEISGPSFFPGWSPNYINNLIFFNIKFFIYQIISLALQSDFMNRMQFYWSRMKIYEKGCQLERLEKVANGMLFMIKLSWREMKSAARLRSGRMRGRNGRPQRTQR